MGYGYNIVEFQSLSDKSVGDFTALDNKPFR